MCLSGEDSCKMAPPASTSLYSSACRKAVLTSVDDSTSPSQPDMKNKVLIVARAATGESVGPLSNHFGSL